MLVQNAAEDPEFASIPVVRLGITRYLGVPIHSPAGVPIGTLCFLDGRSDEPLGTQDVEFLSLLAVRVSAEVERERQLERERQIAEESAALARGALRSAEEKRRFIATVIHDLRQPIAAMRTLLYLLEQEEAPESRAETLGMLEERVAAVTAMIDELVEYARIEAGELHLRPEEIELEGLLEEVLAAHRAEAQAAGIDLQLVHPLEPRWVRTDAAKLSHVVGNLVGNAVKFTAARAGGPAGWVRVSAGPCDVGRWRLQVADNGVGMTAAVQARMCEEFYQGPTHGEGDDPSGAAPGLGLGLAIVRHLCTALRAELAVESSPGNGAIFTVTLPAMLQAG